MTLFLDCLPVCLGAPRDRQASCHRQGSIEPFCDSLFVFVFVCALAFVFIFALAFVFASALAFAFVFVFAFAFVFSEESH